MRALTILQVETVYLEKAARQMQITQCYKVLCNFEKKNIFIMTQREV